MSVARATAQKDVVNAFIKHWKALSVDDMAVLYGTDFEFFSFPTAVLGTKGKTSEEWATFIEPMWAELSNFEVLVHSITNDGEAGRAVLHAKTFGDLPVMPYRNEHIMVLHFSEDGSKIVKLEDMMDSAFAMELTKKMGEYLRNKA